MAYKAETTRVGRPTREGRRFGGLNDRPQPVQISRIDNPDLLNVDFSEHGFSRRLGRERVSQLLRDASLRLDGVNDYARIAHISAYQPAVSTEAIYVGIGVVLRAIPTAAVTIVSKGFGAGANIFFKLTYDPTVGTGVWRAAVYDANAAALRTFDISDGDLIQEPIGRYRFLEWYGGENAASVFRFTADGGATYSTSATTTAINTFISSSEDWTLGIPMSASGTIGAAPYASVTLCEFRYSVQAAASGFSALLGLGGRELSTIPTSEVSFCTGYWKLNDGTTSPILDDSSANANDGFLPNNSAVWVTAPSSEVTGTSAIDFRGTTSWIWLRDAGSPSNFARVFSATTPNVARWTLRGIVVPKYPPGTTSGNVPNQPLIYFGVDPNLPSPVSVRIVANNFQARYNDNGTLRTVTLGTAVDTLVGQRIRWACWRSGTGTGTFYFAIAIPGANNTYTTVSSSVACTGASPTVVSTNCAMGRMVTSFSYPFTFGTVDAAAATFGQCTSVLDDVQLVWTNSTGSFAVGLGTGGGYSNPIAGPGGPLSETYDWSGYGSNASNSTAFYLRMNEGSGNFLKVESQFGASPTSSSSVSGQYAAYLLPEEGDGGRWDIGLVDPFIPPETTYLKSFDRFTSAGTKQKGLLAISGCTLYEVDVDAGVATAKGTGLYKCPSTADRWTSAQYGAFKILAAPNKRRPVWYDGAALWNLGIPAPMSPAVVTLAGAGGTFANVQYYLYYTFRNSLTGAESNPSPGVAFTPAANGKIDVLTLSTSADPQVNQRRVYITLAGGADGATAYLAATIEDNVTTVYGSVGADSYDITAPPVSGVAISSTDGYFNRQEAPQAAIVEQWRDYIWLGGNQQYPTRVYRNVAAGQIHGWDADVYYLDMDQNNGNPITGFIPGFDRMFVDLEDGRGSIYLTGSTTDPVRIELIQSSQGMIGPCSKAGGLPGWYYIGERDIFITNGFQDINISSPDDINLPSIQKTFRDGLSPTRRNAFCAAVNSKRNQVYFAVSSTSSTRNDLMLVWSTALRNWSKYDIPADNITEYDDENGDAHVYAAVFGRIYKLDSGTWDGNSSIYGGTLSGIGSSNSFGLTGTPLAGVDLAGQRLFVHDGGSATVTQYTIYSNTASAITVYETIGITQDGGELWSVGGIPFYFDLLWGFGDGFENHRLRWLQLMGTSDNASNYVRVGYQANQNKRTWAYSGVSHVVRNWGTSDVVQTIEVGGIGKSFRFRISETPAASGVSSPQAAPAIAGTITITDVQVKAEEVMLNG